MRGIKVFFFKEIREMVRTKRMTILLILFFIIGITNALTAKLMPKLLESMADEGFVVQVNEVTAIDAWVQFSKNIMTALIVLLIMFSGTYTSEYSRGTLLPLLTKGLSRSSVVISKFISMTLAWTAGLWLCFGVTYFYSAYYWDISVVKGLWFSGSIWWLFGVFMLSCIVFFSSFAGSGAQVMLGTGGVYIVMSLIEVYDKAAKFLPTRLTNCDPLYYGDFDTSDYTRAIVITAVLSLGMLGASLPLTHRRQL